MRGLTLVNGVREDVSKYPHVCDMILYLYDSKDREDTRDDAIFVEDLFINNNYERDRFISLLDKLEKNQDLSVIRACITEGHVIMFYKSSDVLFFSRKAPTLY